MVKDDRKNSTFIVELTSKRLKFYLVIGWVLVTIGSIFIVLNFDRENPHNLVWGCVAFLYGFFHVWLIRFLIWWNHK